LNRSLYKSSFCGNGESVDNSCNDKRLPALYISEFKIILSVFSLPSTLVKSCLFSVFSLCPLQRQPDNDEDRLLKTWVWFLQKAPVRIITAYIGVCNFACALFE